MSEQLAMQFSEALQQKRIADDITRNRHRDNPASVDAKRCSRCKDFKPVTEFSRHRGMKDGLQAYCKSCHLEYDRQRHGRLPPAERPIHRFWSHVNKTQGCWIWTGRLDRDGYGFLSFESKNFRAHRFSWWLATGERLAANIVLRHTCDTPACVNPDHLTPGTHQDNQADKVVRNRQARGMANGWAKYTDKQIRLVIALLRRGLRQCDIVKLTGVSKYTVSGVFRGKYWRHLNTEKAI